MKKKLEDFKTMSLKEQKEILLIIMSKSIEKSKWIKRLYHVVKSVETDKELNIIKDEFLKIYTFLMEAIKYINSQKLKDSFNNLNKINQKLKNIKEIEKNDLDNENLDILLEKELEIL